MFDRVTGARVPPGALMTYEQALGDYDMNTESKFRNGGRFESGRTERREVEVLSIIYIGKEADRLEEAFCRCIPPGMGASLKRRLARHASTIQHRMKLDANSVLFKAVRVLVFAAMDLETLLIRHYANYGPLAWNMSGFGSNDPGRNRDHTIVKPEGFDASYPVDVERSLPLPLSGTVHVATLLAAVKEALPYVFRYEAAAAKSRRPHPDLAAATVVLPDGILTTRALITLAIGALPIGWQATAFPGRIIIYKEAYDYPHGTVTARSS